MSTLATAFLIREVYFMKYKESEKSGCLLCLRKWVAMGLGSGDGFQAIAHIPNGEKEGKSHNDIVQGCLARNRHDNPNFV
jgi:hypothetical protein